MGKLGLPVPPGFTITTEVCDIFYSNKKKLPTKILSQIKSEIKNEISQINRKYLKEIKSYGLFKRIDDIEKRGLLNE